MFFIIIGIDQESGFMLVPEAMFIRYIPLSLICAARVPHASAVQIAILFVLRRHLFRDLKSAGTFRLWSLDPESEGARRRGEAKVRAPPAVQLGPRAQRHREASAAEVRPRISLPWQHRRRAAPAGITGDPAFYDTEVRLDYPAVLRKTSRTYRCRSPAAR
jgi:hypothetical protein